MTIATDRRQQFETEGYLVIEEAIAGSELTRLQEAFDAAARAGKAGTSIIFDAFGWHTAWSNRGTRPRKSVILTYEKPGEPKQSPFSGLADKLATPERRRLFLWET